MTTASRSDSGKIRIITGPQPGEPAALWRKAPRYAPQVDFPAYRHIPGVTPHPERHADGHSYGLSIANASAVSTENWRKHVSYLHGIDLYHAGYFWEAHEAWEGPWKQASPDSLEANLLQALILNAAALLKVHMGNAAGARTHSQAARWRLARIRSKGYEDAHSHFLGINIGDLIEQVKRFYGPLWESETNSEIRLRGKAPRLVVEGLD